MGIAYKNFWSLNTDEAVVTGILRHKLPKNIEVLLPLNAQLKDVDLVLYNLVNRKSVTVQVKGSRAYEPSKRQLIKYDSGSAGWFMFKKDVILKSTADYFIFLIYVLEENKKSGRRDLMPHLIVIPTEELSSLCRKYARQTKGERYNLILWVNPKNGEAFGLNNQVDFNLTPYLNGAGFKQLMSFLK